MEPVCYIVGAMEPGKIHICSRRPGLIIAADQGLTHLQRQNLVPDLTVGDFDSLGHVPEGDNIIRHPVEKDDPDMMLAVKTGLDRGCRTFVLYGGVGGRLDHTYANFQTLVWLAKQGGRGYLVGDGMISTVIDSGAIFFPKTCRGTISVFCPDGEAHGVTLQGLYYPLEQGTLHSAFPLGVSNSFTGAEAAVSVEEGRLLVMWQESEEAFAARLQDEELFPV